MKECTGVSAAMKSQHPKPLAHFLVIITWGAPWDLCWELRLLSLMYRFLVICPLVLGGLHAVWSYQQESLLQLPSLSGSLESQS